MAGDARASSRFEQESGGGYAKFVFATLPLAVVLFIFSYEAYQRPNKPFYNLPSYVTDDYSIKLAAEQSGSLVPLMDMVYVVLSFSVFWAILASYFLGFLWAQKELIDEYLTNATMSLGNVVYERRWWACEFRYYGYCSYQHPDDQTAAGKDQHLIRKTVRIYEPYTRELVPILCLPGYPKSGQGKDDVEFAQLKALKSRPRELFFGRFSLLWALICVADAGFILNQMRIIDEAEYYAGITDDYDSVELGMKVFCLFMSCGIFGVAMCGMALCWFHRRWWLIYQGTSTMGELSIHGFDGVVVTESGDDYQQMNNEIYK